VSRLAALLILLAAAPAPAAVPISIAPTGHAVVPVIGPFGTWHFVFDTGAEGSAVYAALAEEAGLEATGTETLQGQTGAVETPLLRIDSLALDGVTKGPIEAVRLEARADGIPLPGIVGLDLFGDRTIDFDLPRRSLALLEPGQRPAGLSGEGLAAIPTTGGLLTIPVTIGRVQAVAVIDTGARKTRINWALGRLLGFTPETLPRGEVIQGATNTAIETASARVRDVRLGRRALGEAPVLVADLPVFEAFGVAGQPAIILGLDWLEQSRLVIDFPARLVWFEESTPPPALTIQQTLDGEQE
jgi:predicted aspartyl protease